MSGALPIIRLSCSIGSLRHDRTFNVPYRTTDFGRKLSLPLMAFQHICHELAA
jgi:hypothetical protein